MNGFLVGERIYLRGFDAADAPLTVEWFNRPEVRRTTRQYLPKTVAGQKEWLARGSTDRDIVFGIVLREDDRPVGACGLHHLDIRSRHAELGLMIGDPADWGRGLASEASRLLIDYGFGELNLHRIWLEVHADNPPAQHIYEKLGFRLEGTLRQHTFREGSYVDSHTMGLLADEWRLARS